VHNGSIMKLLMVLSSIYEMPSGLLLVLRALCRAAANMECVQMNCCNCVASNDARCNEHFDCKVLLLQLVTNELSKASAAC
jgi:hypothetical protein